MENTEQFYSRKEVAEEIAKSMYKAVLSSLRNNKKKVDIIVDDIKDPNMIAEVPPQDIPTNKKVDVLDKSLKSQSDIKKGIDKLKQFICSRKQ